MKYTQIAAPGTDIELLSLKAFNALKSADAVLLDEEANPDILLFTSPECLLFGNLNDLCDYLQSVNPGPHWNLVRVMADSPRFDENAYNELRIFVYYGFFTEIIPGINLINNLSATDGFALTQRGKSESFCVVNCKEVNNMKGIFKTISQAAASTSSIVLLNAGKHAHPFIKQIARYRDKCESMLFIEKVRSEKKLKSTLGEFLKSPPLNLNRFDVIIIGLADYKTRGKISKQGELSKIFDLT